MVITNLTLLFNPMECYLNDTSVIIENMVNYPTKKKSNLNQNTRLPQTKKGMNLEDDLNQTNAYYRDHDIAIVHKKPTPITVVTVDYPSRSKARITEAYYKVASTTDYNGIYKGMMIDFEAKETQSKTAFSLSNIHAHQIDHMVSIQKHGGLAFLIIRFVTKDETFLLFIEDLVEFVKMNSRQSLPYDWIVDHGHKVPYKFGCPVPYLSVLDSVQLKGVLK